MGSVTAFLILQSLSLESFSLSLEIFDLLFGFKLMLLESLDPLFSLPQFLISMINHLSSFVKGLFRKIKLLCQLAILVLHLL